MNSTNQKDDPALLALREYASQYTVEAVRGLVRLAKASKTPAGARVLAWREVLDRGHGRPPQSLEHTGKGGGPVQVVVSEADERI